MKVEILTTFTGFPEGPAGEEKTFLAGAVADVADDFGKLIVGKGLARESLARDAKNNPKGSATE